MPTLNDILYRSGDVFLPLPARVFLETYLIGNDRSLFYITYWSWVHFGSGVLTAWILLSYYPRWNFYLTGFVVHTLWEFWQIFIGMTPWKTLRGQVDIAVDTAMFMLGMVFFMGLFTGKRNE
jgi:hypothetical protein